jgi:hypothetical protein
MHAIWQSSALAFPAGSGAAVSGIIKSAINSGFEEISWQDWESDKCSFDSSLNSEQLLLQVNSFTNEGQVWLAFWQIEEQSGLFWSFPPLGNNKTAPAAIAIIPATDAGINIFLFIFSINIIVSV